MKKTALKYSVLVLVIFCINFLFARFAPAVVKNNIWISAFVIAVLDGIVFLVFGWIWHK